MPTYLGRLKAHLAHYKRTRLGVVEDGTWARNKRPYEHILPIARREENILEPIRSAFWAFAEKKGLISQLHRDFHHLTSSQALAFNFFFPFVGLPWGEPTILLDALGLPPKKISDFEFEAVPDKKEGTNFDFVVTFNDGTRLLVEVKLGEGEFGRCKADSEHTKKLTHLYQERLAGKVTPTALEAATFFARYQLLRNVSHVRPGDTLVLLLPKANRRPFAQAERFVRNSLTDATRQAVRIIALEDLVKAAQGARPGPMLSQVLELLAEKYIPVG